MGDTNTSKKHADFQDRYRRSSNFSSVVKKEAFRISGDGEVVLDTDRPVSKN